MFSCHIFWRHFLLAQTVAKKNISKRPWRVIVNAMAYIRREYNTESTLGILAFILEKHRLFI
jgi:hypothetical protein